MVGGGIVAAIVSPEFRNFLPKIGIFLLLALLFGLMAWGVWLLLRSRTRKKRGEELGGGVGTVLDHGAAASNDHEQKARFEAMKRKFMLLIERLRKEGRDIYEMPWFMTIGPSGTGKSWVLKGGGLEPLDDVEWKGGTYMMDWWTCGEALVLDTAGGVVFGEERYDSPEWTSLLKLLKQQRPQCPINGIFVVVPAQLLWLKPSELPAGWLGLEEYADRLRTQIRGRLQRAIGVRFPVYFLVTQSDRIPGFREFADALDAEGKPKSQMLGWSNPLRVGEDGGNFKSGADPRKTPEYAQVQALAEHLAEVAADVRRQRLTLLESYVGKGAQPDENGMGVRKRAADLFSFADAIQTTLAPRLQELLLAVFKPDGLLPRPPYLRGVYFTSALREGEVLDRHLARVVGKPLSVLALPGSVDKKQPNPFFLKDLIFKKAFAEAWLVTPLEDARTYLRHRRRALYIGGIGAAALLLLAIGIGGWSYYENVGKELKAWEDVRSSATKNSWLPIVSSEGNALTLVEKNLGTHFRLADQAKKGLGSSSFWSFGWFFNSSKLDTPRRKAQLKLFERGVIGSMAEIAKNRLQSNPPASEGDATQKTNEIARFQGALLAVLELELATKRPWKDDELGKSRDRVVRGLVEYLLPKSVVEATQESTSHTTLNSLTTIFDYTYSDADRRKEWPPARTGNLASLTNFLTAAFAQLARLQESQLEALSVRRESIEGLLKEAKGIQTNEHELIVAISNRRPSQEIDEALTNLSSSWKTLSTNLERHRIQLLAQAFTNFALQVTQDAEGHRERFRKQLMLVNGASSTGTNLTGVVEWSFTNLTKATPAVVGKLVDFEDLLPQAEKIDHDFLAQFPETGQPHARSSVTQRLMDQRMDAYRRALNGPVALPKYWKDDFFEGEKQAEEGVKTLINEASRAWSRIPTAAFTNLSLNNTPRPGGASADSSDPAYSAILSNHFTLRHLEELLKQSEIETTNRLRELTSQFRAESTASRVFEDLTTALNSIGTLNGIWLRLERTWRDVSGSGTGSKSRKTFSGSEITRSTNSIYQTKISLIRQVAERIEKEQTNYVGFPLPRHEDTRLIDGNTVKNAWEKAKEWKEALTTYLDKARTGVYNDQVKDQVDPRIRNWQGEFKLLVDDKGRLFDYRITTPWARYTNLLEKRLLSPAAMQTAIDDAGRYRSWEFKGRNVEATTPGSMAVVAADEGFELKFKEDGDPASSTASISGKNKSLKDRWTIIDLIRKSSETGSNQSGESPYLIPIEVEGGRFRKVTVWFVVERVDPTR